MPEGIREVSIRDLADLIRAVTPAEPDPTSGRLRERAVYRGVADTEYGLLTSLDRLGCPDVPPHSKGHLEAHLLRNFLRYSRPHLPPHPMGEWEILVVAQHHGLPTRLLDWSYSPLTAAHFATIDGSRPTDRVVWRLDWGRMHERFGLPPLSLLVADLDRELCRRGIGSPWELFEGERVPPDHFVALLEPPALDQRLVTQAAAFTLSSDRSRGIDRILVEAGLAECLTRCVIPAESVDRVRDQLDLCDVGERRLFPDLDGVAAEMRRYYSANSAQDGPEPRAPGRAPGGGPALPAEG